MSGTQHFFQLEKISLSYDPEKSILMCKGENGKNLWAKKLNDIAAISEIEEDPDTLFISSEIDEKRGQFIAISKDGGNTKWHIPGRALFQKIFGIFIYLIFIDDENQYYLIKVDRSTGEKIWYFRVDEDLSEYSFRNDRILLKYESGKEEKISTDTGKVIN
jgi:outer membrane protein assembly factor BamB